MIYLFNMLSISLIRPHDKASRNSIDLTIDECLSGEVLPAMDNYRNSFSEQGEPMFVSYYFEIKKQLNLCVLFAFDDWETQSLGETNHQNFQYSNLGCVMQIWCHYLI